MTGKKPRPVIVKKKVSGHGGHHGGAWKVAYADFVTAMMAFFMVMWILGMDSRTKDLVQGYFQNPIGFEKGYGAGRNPLSTGNSPDEQDVRSVAMALREAEQSRLGAVGQRIRMKLSEDDALAEIARNFEVALTSEGLRIELIDAGRGDVFFSLGSARPQELLTRALTLIGAELAELPNDVVLEGHTDALRYGSVAYSNWELSADRANAARRLLVEAGVDADRISEIRGYADRDLRVPERPADPANRRISVLVRFSEVPLPLPASADSLLGANATPRP